MMTATFFRDPEKRIVGFQISGHSSYGEAGTDIVCAAVSALAQNTVNSIEILTGDEPEALAVNEEEGFMHYRLKQVSENSGLLLRSLQIGLESVRASYGEPKIHFQEV